jgi:hypothetical protein
LQWSHIWIFATEVGDKTRDGLDQSFLLFRGLQLRPPIKTMGQSRQRSSIVSFPSLRGCSDLTTWVRFCLTFFNAQLPKGLNPSLLSRAMCGRWRGNII